MLMLIMMMMTTRQVVLRTCYMTVYVVTLKVLADVCDGGMSSPEHPDRAVESGRILVFLKFGHHFSYSVSSSVHSQQ